MACVYILKSTQKQITYVGSTDNMDRRLSEHNSGKSLFTKRYMPWVLVYKEEFLNIADARKREKYLKSAAGRKFVRINNIIPE